MKKKNKTMGSKGHLFKVNTSPSLGGPTNSAKNHMVKKKGK